MDKVVSQGVLLINAGQAYLKKTPNLLTGNEDKESGDNNEIWESGIIITGRNVDNKKYSYRIAGCGVFDKAISEGIVIKPMPANSIQNQVFEEGICRQLKQIIDKIPFWSPMIANYEQCNRKNVNYNSLAEYYNNLSGELFALSSYILEYSDRTSIEDLFNQMGNAISDMANSFVLSGVNYRLIAIEGERCSGKDTLINNLKSLGLKSVYYAPRNVPNRAWTKLNSLKKNCYFDIGNTVASIGLWFSDLAARLSLWIKESNGELILANRYIYSVMVTRLGIEARHNCDAWIYIWSLMGTLRRLFVSPIKTIILQADINQIRYRMRQYRNRTFTTEEMSVAQSNIMWFDRIKSTNIIRINSENVPKAIHEKAFNIITQYSK